VIGSADSAPRVPVEALEAARAFGFDGRINAVTPLGRGLINDTYRVDQGAGCWVLQRLNPRVFENPEAIMDNLHIIAAHLETKSYDAGGLRLPRPLWTLDGRRLLRCGDDQCWRGITYIDQSVSLERITRPSEAFEVGRALGLFHGLFDDLPPERLHDTLPGFHEAPGYLLALDDRVADLPREGLSKSVLEALHFIDARRDLVPVLERGKRQGDLVLAVIHGDPKLDNVLFDPATGRAISLIDLDTVKPGLRHYDLGDCFRSCCNKAGEAEGGPVRFDLAVFEAVLGGYFEVARGVFSRVDVDYLYDAIRLLPLELGIRFLTDHLGGSTYFKIDHPGQNVQRAERQFHLVASIEAQEVALRAIIERLYRG
jgi:Ser/Thr protein kinase RdoA (MazF antagonist)